MAVSPLSRNNLVRTGGDRTKGKRQMIEVIRVSLFDGLSDKEIRGFFGLGEGGDVAPEMRSKMAKAKAERVYNAIIAGWISGIKKPLSYEGGQNVAGVLKLGVAGGGTSFRMIPTDQSGVPLSESKKEMWREPVPFDQELGHLRPDQRGPGAKWDPVTETFYKTMTSGENGPEEVIWDAKLVATERRQIRSVILDTFWAELNGITV